MTQYVWECKYCGTRYVEGFSRVSKPYIGMEFKIPCPHRCKVHPGVTNESIMVLKEIKNRKLKRVVDISPCVFGQVKCTECKISSEIGWYKTDGVELYCPICGYKMGIFKQKKETRE